MRSHPALLLGLAVALGITQSPSLAEDWSQWRGSHQNGVSGATDLISSWSRDGENLLWRQDFTGRSTPVVLGGKVFVAGRAGEGPLRRELLAAFDAESGRPLWEHAISTDLTTVPYNRAGWASPVADRETGYIYYQGVGGPFVCLDAQGNVVWERPLHQEIGRFSGYGGRTHTPVIDEDLVIASVVNGSWGKLGAPRHRYYAFDKRTGGIVWVSTPGGTVFDRNTTSNGLIAVIGGQRLFISGNADGHIYALNARTGSMVWGFELSKRGINSSPIVVGDLVIVGHSEENIDEATLGRTVAIDATGHGDITGTHERWRRDIKMGFPSAMAHGDTVYVMNNSANLYALDPATGDTRWEHSLGTVGKSAPVWAGGKIYVTETNGNFHILQEGSDGVSELDRESLTVSGGRYAEIYGSPAIAYGRIYFTTEEGLYALGKPDAPYVVRASPPVDLGEEAPGGDLAKHLLVVPGDVTVAHGERLELEVRAFNENGRPLASPAVSWSLEGLTGNLRDGVFTPSIEATTMAGEVVVRSGDLEARARVRVFAPLPLTEDFSSVTGRGRPQWIGAGRYQVVDKDGEKVLSKPVAERGLLRSNLFIGPPDWSNYTIQAEVMGNLKGRRRTDMGLINSGYFLDLLGNSQKLEVRSWTAARRMAVTVPLEWEMATWYVMKLQVETTSQRAQIRGKVWKKGESEPADWTIEAEDPLPVRHGAPGLQGYSPAEIYYDNVRVWVNE